MALPPQTKERSWKKIENPCGVTPASESQKKKKKNLTEKLPDLSELVPPCCCFLLARVCALPMLSRVSMFTECSALLAALSTPSAPLVLDCGWLPPGTSQRDLYAKRRIPTAHFFDIDGVSDHASPLPHMLPSASAFSQHMAALGVSKQRPVVIYDRHGLLAAARVWWTLRVFGHPSVSVLVGGFPRWESEGHPIETSPLPAPPPPPPPLHYCS